MDVINAIGSIGTLVMAFFYFISVSMQLYQMRLGFSPALGFEQTFIIHEDGKFKLQNAVDLLRIGEEGIDYFSLYNLGGGTAKNINIDIYLDNESLQNKYVHILPGNESYLLPVNDKVHDGLKQALIEKEEPTELTIEMQYKSSIRQKWQAVTLVAQFDSFSDNSADKTIFEVQFVNTDSEDNNDNEKSSSR
ncbi:hypothetical protein LQF61_05680 [Tetragenococcus koreensis]|uniref:Uncharacterized protein n=1 Tax=Tetragenococcus koreensis TaxID=290335 RepID=A0AAN4RKE5_9ENTE|nr:hypothetical protein [Tetragenococcus koreensis]AYW45566.1 hypothetical protein C7K43_06190 [Tetragenococcus koreensis]MCF1585574.1 hypothetical protein [Tetragenococcus koreensis]MCF1615120.1 hypothetical protein [Tetragenococcus koreensis]MCF1617756.1 hypothetical protein [Tetragenococcus koreensis]MCF1619571.1 hypothetical protein [Tetragenococcus koreensis]